MEGIRVRVRRVFLRDSHRYGVVDVERHVARVELGEVALGHVDRARHAEHLAVELDAALDVGRGDGGEIDPGDDLIAHASDPSTDQLSELSSGCASSSKPTARPARSDTEPIVAGSRSSLSAAYTAPSASRVGAS